MFKAATLESIQNAPYLDVLSSVCDCDIECVNIWTQELPETGYLKRATCIPRSRVVCECLDPHL